MKKVEYETKEGKKGVKYVLEVGDKVTAKYDTPRESKIGKFSNYSLAVNEEFGFIQLTKAQYEKLVKVGALTGKTIEAYAYENDFGKQIGVRVL